MKHVREYANHAEYLRHQCEKTTDPVVIERFIPKRASRIQSFSLRFEFLKEFCPPPAYVLCLGARYGEEVAGFRTLGYEAIGVDLVPYPDLVIEADFHALPFADGTVDLIYSNAVDHVFDMPAFAAEICRVLRPGGWVYVHLFFRDKDFGLYEVMRLADDAEFAASLPGFHVAKRVEANGQVWLLLHREEVLA
ncbi:MAG TPA: class I SAM-dependent methyltransferase [Thermoguttaceae bacterium]|nr:class I SAM-dependent methyltransferase [Thermoguttaceae bacterium]